jgi:hypothetical protein
MALILRRATILLTLFAAFQPAYAAPSDNPYYGMCLQSVKMPKPFGEWDLKDNPKLPAYCECFSAAFHERAMKSLSSNAKPPSLEESNRQELALRNTCRAKTGLPAAVEVK